MRFARAIILLLTLSSSLIGGGFRPVQEASAVVQPSQAANSRNDVEALRSDLRRMKVLVQQMESNLAFVDTTQSPLKHQFQLEIDMWKTVIGEMERKLDAAGAH